jgi:peptidoglycan/LPS O-acetylase OafA/YrhL
MDLVAKCPDTERLKSSYHITELDGLRGLAILLVFITHTTTGIGVEPSTEFGKFVYGLLKIGWSGVDLFFVLSGFLITGILVDHKKSLSDKPRRYFGYFYARRALRIFPLYYVSLIVVFVVAELILGNSLDYKNFTIHSLYLQNILDGYPMALSHFLSLAVEEHFYLILPLVIYWIPSKYLGKIFLLGVAFAISVRFSLEDSTLNVYRFSLTRFDSLLMGSLLALEYRSIRGLWKNSFAWLSFAAALLFVFLLVVGETSNQAKEHRLIGYSLFGFFYFCLIRQIISSNENSNWKSIFRSSFLRWCGKLSYCIYLVHWPVVLIVKKMIPQDLDWTSSALLITTITAIVSFTIATLSWRWFESPILSLRRHFVSNSH